MRNSAPVCKSTSNYNILFHHAIVNGVFFIRYVFVSRSSWRCRYYYTFRQFSFFIFRSDELLLDVLYVYPNYCIGNMNYSWLWAQNIISKKRLCVNNRVKGKCSYCATGHFPDTGYRIFRIFDGIPLF